MQRPTQPRMCKLYSLSFYGLLVSCLWISGCSSQTTESCTQKLNSCACKTAGGYINLENLDQAKKDGKPKWPGLADTIAANTIYAYNPCTAFTSVNCTSVAGCQTQLSVNYPIGTQDTATFKTDSTLGTILVYTATDVSSTNSGRTLQVQLVCDPDQEGSLSDAREDTPGTYDMKLTTKYACSDIAPPPGGGSGGGLSPGSIMLIIFFVCITVYLVGGVLFNKFYKGASGKEVVPNVDFWIVLPGLARDGVLYSWNKVRGVGGKNASYEDI